MNVTTRALTPRRSVSIPERILQIVLQIPTMEMRKEAFTLEMPREVARLYSIAERVESITTI